jgi:catechol-2,3-dioxygenase
MASPKKLSHIVLQTNRRREMIDWYCTVLGAEILYEAERISFISYDDEHHRVAFLDPGPLAEREPDGPRAGKEAGLHHVAFTFGGLDDLTDNYLRLKEIGISPHRCVNHGVTTSMYYFDPDHNQVELLVDNFATAAEGQAYMRGRSATDKNPVGIVYEPDERRPAPRRTRLDQLSGPEISPAASRPGTKEQPGEAQLRPADISLSTHGLLTRCCVGARASA